MKSILFIHRSVGHNLIADGNVRKLISAHSVLFNDYDQNINILTLSDGTQKQCGFKFPDDDTKPAGYAQIFSVQATGSAELIRDFALEHDTIVIKSCYPNSNIKDDSELESLKESYSSIAKFFNEYPQKSLIILTTPPLAPMMTTSRKAHYARLLSEWLVTMKLGENVSIFNFYDLLADTNKNWLRRRYRRFLPFNSHPSENASVEIAPKFVQFLIAKSA